MKNFQRDGATSNTQVGRDFESKSKAFFSQQGMQLEAPFKIKIGFPGGMAKEHKFDLGDRHKKVLIECKSRKWTEGRNVPSAKMTTWNQAMYYFCLAPKAYRKILFVRRDVSSKREETLAEYYIKTNRHLIPDGVEIWEFDEKRKTARRLEFPD